MKVTVHSILSISEILGATRIDIEVAKEELTVGELLSELEYRYGFLTKLRRRYNFDQERLVVLVDGRDIRALKGVKTLLKENSHILLLPPAAGG